MPITSFRGKSCATCGCFVSPPEDLQGIVKDAIEAYIEPGRWQEAIDKSTDDRGKIVAAIGNVKVYLSDTLA